MPNDASKKAFILTIVAQWNMITPEVTTATTLDSLQMRANKLNYQVPPLTMSSFSLGVYTAFLVLDKPWCVQCRFEF